MNRTAVLLCFFLFAASGALRGQVETGGPGTFSGTVYMDYYWMAANHNDGLEGRNGFWFRRIYLTYDRELGGAFDTRLRLEMSNPGDFITNSKMTPVVKDAWLRWSNGNHAVIAGISPTPTFGLTEDVWGYRSVEKSPQDLYGLGGSRDFGLAAKGSFGDGMWDYHVMLGNGTGNGTEIDKGKKLMLALARHLNDRWVVEVYGDWNDRPGSRYRLTLQGFAGYRSERFNLGVLYTHQYRNAQEGVPDRTFNLASLFFRGRLSDSAEGFFRVDHHFTPNPGGETNAYIPFSDRAEATFMAGGIDFPLHENIHLIPNIEAIVYGEAPSGENPESDLIPRLTLFMEF